MDGLQYFEAIIRESIKSNLGILALALLLMALLAFWFFKNSNTATKLLVFFAMMGFSVTAFGFAFYNTEIDVPGAATQEPPANGPESNGAAATSQPRSIRPPVAVAEAPPTRPTRPTVSVYSMRPEGDRPLASETIRRVCEPAWSQWGPVKKSVPDPCRDGCTRGAELERQARARGFPPKIQVRYKLECR